MRKLPLKLAIVLAFAAILVLFHYLGVLRPFENLVARVTEPLAGWQYSLSTRLKGIDLRSRTELQERLSACESQGTELKSEIARLRIGMEESALGQTQQDFLEQKGYGFAPANVIGRNPDNSLHSLIINKGKSDGVIEGLAVIAENGVLVGKIIDVQDHYSSFLLLDDNTSKAAALVLSQENANGLVAGERGLSLKLDLVPLDAGIEENDLIVTSGLELNIPRGLVIGEVDAMVTSIHDLFQSATVRPIVDYDSLSVLAIILPQT